MQGFIELAAVELLCSRLCHDLISPVAAINNGVELLEEMGTSPQAGGDAMDLIADSATAAARRLSLFRLAFGAAGGQGTMAERDARAALQGWFAGGRVRLAWELPAQDWPPGMLKAALIGALVAEESLPRGGSLRLSPIPQGLCLSAEGPGCGLWPEAAAVLTGEGAQETPLGPRTILSHLLPSVVGHYRLRLGIETPAAEVLIFQIVKD